MLTPTRAVLVAVAGLFTCLIGGCAADSASAKRDAEATSALLAEAQESFIQEQLAKGHAAIDANERAAGEEAALRVLAIRPDDDAGRALLRRAESSGLSGIETPLLVRYVDDISLRRQAALAEYYDLMDLSRRLLKAGNYDAAQHAVLAAMLVLDQNRAYLLPADRRTGVDEVKEQGRVIEEKRIKTDQERDAATDANGRRERDNRRAVATGRTRDEANRLVARADSLRRAQRYQESLDLLRQAQWLDPSNKTAAAMRESVEDAIVLTSAGRAYRARTLHVGAQAGANMDATAPGGTVLTYPADWPALTAARLAE